MSEFKSLRKNWEFQAVYRNGKSKANRCFVMIIKKNDTSSNRVGISVSKKVGNSIVRHRVTRVIREVMRLHWGEIKSGYDIVIVARPSAKDSDYGKFESAIFHLLNLHHLLKDDKLQTESLSNPLNDSIKAQEIESVYYFGVFVSDLRK